MLAFLNQLLGKFKQTNQSVLGIDIGSSSIKLVQLKRKDGRAVLETYGTLSLGPYAGTEIGRATNLPSAKIAEGITDLLKEAKTTTRVCGLSIPIASSLISFIRLPLVNDKQLAQMIPIEARKYVPVPISEVTLDWLVIPKDENMSNIVSDSTDPEDGHGKSIGMVDILLVVIHNDVLTKNREIASDSLLSASFFEIETFSTIRAVIDQGIVPVGILDIGAATSKLYIVERGVLKNSHIISRGSQEITLAISRALGVGVDVAEQMKRTHGISHTPAAKNVSEICSLTLDYVFDEVKKVVGAYERKSNQTVSRIVLSGGGSLLPGLVSFASQKLAVDIELANPFSKVDTPAFLSEVLATSGPEFATAIGIALRKLQELE